MSLDDWRLVYHAHRHSLGSQDRLIKLETLSGENVVPSETLSCGCKKLIHRANARDPLFPTEKQIQRDPLRADHFQLQGRGRGCARGIIHDHPRNHADAFCPFAFHTEEPEVHVRIPEWAPLVAHHSSGPDDTGCMALDVNC